MMLHCLHKSGGVTISNAAEMTVLERQRSRIKWQKQELVSSSALGSDEVQGQLCKDSNLLQVGIPMVNLESELDIAWTRFGNYGMPSAEDFEFCGYADDTGTDYSYPIMKNCPEVSIIGESSEGKGSILTATEGGKKRRAERALKIASHDDTKVTKKIKEWAEDVESKVTQHTRSSNNKNNNKANEASREASKVSEVQKTDYIHVRARRGEATDSHSLAERVRREKISERMKYLQELVPGCNKITGKAGMLDEIINYVQSLQRQVESLSMKLATINPQLNFSIDSLFGKEVVSPCTSSYPTLGELSEMANPASEMDIGNYYPEIENPQQCPEAYVDVTAFNQNPTAWDADLHNLLGMEFQGSTSFPSQPLRDSTEAHNRKMEI